MFSGKDAGSYPTQWALNPTAYQNVDASQVDWAALAQQWIAMKEAVAIISAPPPPSLKPDAEEGEAPMEVENPESNNDGPNAPSGSEWEESKNNWDESWNQWSWGWSNTGTVDPKLSEESSMAIPPMVDGFPGTSNNSATIPGYSTSGGPAPTFQHGYWTAPQVEQLDSRGNSSGRDRNSKSKNRERTTRTRMLRDKPPILPPVIEPIVAPTMPTIDAAKRRQLPAWIREGLEKMEREKLRAIEREEEKKVREAAEKEKKKLEEEELKRIKAEASGEAMLPPKSKFESDSEDEKDTADKPVSNKTQETEDSRVEEEEEGNEEKELPPSPIKKSQEEIMQEVMLAVRRSLTEILLEVTDQEIHTVSQEEFARYSTAQASRLNAMKASKSKALAAITSGLGLGAYESSSEDSADEDEHNDLTDQQLQDLIRRKRLDFERTSREIEAEVRRAEQREVLETPVAPNSATPDRPKHARSSTTPPPIDRDTPEKISERRVSKDKRNSHKSTDRVDGVRKLETIPEERLKKTSRKDRTPSPQQKVNNKADEESSSSSSDSDDSSSSSSSKSSSESEQDKVDTRKRKRKTSSSDESRRKTKRPKEKSHKYEEKDYYSKSSRRESYEKTVKSKSKKKDDYYEKHKSSRSRDYEKTHKEKYRDESDDERNRKRSKRSRSVSYESRSGRKKTSRDQSEERSKRREKRSYDRESSRRDRSYERSGRDYEKYDRYERSRDYDRRRSRSHSRHRR